MIKNRFLAATCALLALTASSSVWAQQQYARPDSTTTPSGWTPVNSASLHEALASVDNGNWIDSTPGNNSTVIVTLSDVNDPGTYANNHIIRFSCQATVGGKPKGGEGCDVALYQGGTQIATTLNNTANRGAFAIVTYTIPDASAITDYSNLELRITSSALDVDESIQVSWAELELPAPAASAPSVTTSPATVISDSEATVGGNVSNDGNDPLLEVGVYYSQSPGITPPTEFPKFSITPVPSVPPGDFAGNLTGLSRGTTYYFKAYATNSIGEQVAANEESFTTWDFPTLLATPTVGNIQLTSATLGGTVTSDGNTTVTDCGVTWGTTSGAGPYTNSASAAFCTTDNPFTIDTSSVGPLATGTTYFFRSYATNAVGTAYSAQEGDFVPSGPPQLDATVDLGTVTDTQALLGGDITDDGGSAITAVGIYWDTIGTDPRNDGTHVPMTVTEPSFDQIVTGLPPGKTIYFFAYATNGAGTTDSTIINFATDPGAPTMDPTPTVANIVGDGADLGGTIIADGGGANLDCGVEWTTVPGEPYESSQSFESPPNNGTCVEGAFAVTVSGLTSGQTYYVRAYATSDAGSDYSNEASFIPQAAPIVSSSAALDVTHNSATLGGNVTSDEGSPVTERGIVWDLNPNPEGQPTGTKVPMGSGTGTFEQTVSLPSGDRIYFEAYAVNSIGTRYSNQERFVDTATEPTVQATSLVLEPFGRSVRVSWTRGNGDGSLVAVWQDPPNTIDAPLDFTDYIADPNYSNTPPPPETSTGSGNFVVYKGSNNTILVNGLELNTTYNFAVYEYAGTGANSDYIQANPATGPKTTGDTPVHNYDYAINCEQCHKHGTIRPRQDELETKCKTCHTAGEVAAAKQEFKNHLLPQRNPDIDFVDCGMCHELHRGALTQTRSISFVDSIERLNKSFLRKNVSKYVPNAVEPAVLHNDQPKRVDGNASGYTPIAADTPERAVEGSDASTARGYCQVCHTMTAYHRNNPSAGASTPSDHGKAGFMQCHDGGTVNEACAPEVHCGDCHEHNNSFQGVNSNVPCEQCHDQPQGLRPIITTQFDTANVLSSHIPNGTPTKPDCVVCHGDHSHDGFVYGYDADDGVTKYTHPTSKQDTLSTGAGENYEPHCLSCHDDGVASSLAADGGPPTAGQTQSSPFINSNSPPLIDATAWANSGHDRDVATFPSNPVTCVGDGANGCHGSGHGSYQPSLLAPAADPLVHATTFCTNCHNGSVGQDILAQFTPTIPQQTAGDAYVTVNKKHDVLPADQTYSSTALSCKGCHDPHVNNASNPVVNLDTGAALGTYDVTNSYSGDVASFSYGGAGQINPVNPPPANNPGYTEPDAIEFCLTCHDGTQPGNIAMPAGMLNIAAEYPNSQHGGASNRSTQKGWLKYPFTNAPAVPAPADYDDGTTPYAALNCTTCHGPHGSENIYNLRSSITVAGVQMTVGATDVWIDERGQTTYLLPGHDTGTQENLGWGAWCSFCHDVNHDTRTGFGCQSSHMHGGGGNF